LNHASQAFTSGRTEGVGDQRVAPDRPDVFLSYAREDKEFVEGRLTRALVAHGKDVWIDVEDIRGGASDWRASVWAGIESAKAVVFVLTPNSLGSSVCGEELQRAEELNKRIIPVLRRPVDDGSVPPALARPNWILARPEDDFDASVAALVDALELDEPWVEQHARLTQRTVEWLRHDRDGSYLLRGSDLRAAESWLDDQGGHREAPTAEQATYITASRRAAARRQRGLLAGVALALAITAVLAVVAVVQRGRAIDREKTARAQARAAQSLAELSQDPEESVRDALAAVAIRRKLPEARFALRRAVSLAGWTSILRLPDARDVNLLDVEFSDDGRRVATASSDGRVAVWDTRTGRLVTVAHTGGAVSTVQFSPDGRQLLTASEGGVAQIWNSSDAQQQPLRKFNTKSARVWAATWGAGGRRILTASPSGGEVWKDAGGRPLRLASEGKNNYGAIKMSLDGRRALTAGENGDARLWNLITGKWIATLRGRNKTDPLRFSLLSNDGRRFVTVYYSGAFCVWDDGRPRPRMCAPRTGAPPTDVDLSRDGRRFLRADANGVVAVWDLVSRHPKPIARLPSAGTVASAQFDRSGEYVVAGRDDGFAQVWRVKPRRRLALLHGHTRGVRRARFSPDGRQVATISDDGSGRLWPARPRTPADPEWQSAQSTSFSPNSRAVLVVRGARRAIWNTDTGKVVELDGGGFPVPFDSGPEWPCGHAAGCAPWSSPDGRLVAGANTNGRAVVWNARTGHVARTFGKERTVTEAAFSPHGRFLVFVDVNRRRARIWDVLKRKPKPEEQVPGRHDAHEPLKSAQFVANPLRVLTVDAFQNVQLSTPETGETVALPGAAFPAAVAAARDGGRIALGTTHGELQVFSRAGGAPREQHVTGAVNSLEFDRDGTTIATGGQKGTAATWDTRTLRPTRLRAFGGQISGATFSPGGDLLLVTSEAAARLWDWRLRRIVVELPRTAAVRGEFSPDGSRIVIAGKTRLEVVACYACLPLKKLEQRGRALLPAS
jgi:WD40 repeat protein